MKIMTNTFIKFVISLIIVITINHALYSQGSTLIIKKCSSSKNASFPSKYFICQKLYYKNLELIGAVNYSYNGWQVYDSISYTEGRLNCFAVFQPVYKKEGDRKISSYKETDVICNEKSINEKYFQTKDKYSLSKFYSEELISLLDRNPIKSDNEFKFATGTIPSLFTEYGIPYNEQLNSFSFEFNDQHIIVIDCFNFSNYVVKRTYSYADTILQEVKVTVKNNALNSVVEYVERFEVGRN